MTTLEKILGSYEDISMIVGMIVGTLNGVFVSLADELKK